MTCLLRLVVAIVNVKPGGLNFKAWASKDPEDTILSGCDTWKLKSKFKFTNN